MAVRAARSQIKDDKTHVRYMYTSSPRTSTAEPLYVPSKRLPRRPDTAYSAFHTDQVDPTAPPLPRRTTGRRRTPGPSAPASWTAAATAAAAVATPVEPDRALTQDEQADKRWRMWEGWCREVVEGFVGVEKMPFEVQRRRREVPRSHEHGLSDVAPLRGPPSLVNSTIRLLSRHMDAVNSGETSWLTSPDVKQFLGTEVRMSVMLHAVWDGGTTWRGVRDMALGCVVDHAQTEQPDDEEEAHEDWDASSSSSSSEPPPTIPHLPLLDFSFASLPHPGSRDHRALTRYLAAPDVRATVEAISVAGTSMGPREVVELLAKGEGKTWGVLRSVSLAGVRGGVEEWRVGLMKLARYAPGLEVRSRPPLTILADSFTR